MEFYYFFEIGLDIYDGSSIVYFFFISKGIYYITEALLGWGWTTLISTLGWWSYENDWLLLIFILLLPWKLLFSLIDDFDNLLV